MKLLIEKCTDNTHFDENKYYAGLLEWRNTPKADGSSPSQILYGHSLRSLVPAHLNSFTKLWKEAASISEPTNEDEVLLQPRIQRSKTNSNRK